MGADATPEPDHLKEVAPRERRNCRMQSRQCWTGGDEREEPEEGGLDAKRDHRDQCIAIRTGVLTDKGHHPESHPQCRNGRDEPDQAYGDHAWKFEVELPNGRPEMTPRVPHRRCPPATRVASHATTRNDVRARKTHASDPPGHNQPGTQGYAPFQAPTLWTGPKVANACLADQSRSGSRRTPDTGVGVNNRFAPAARSASPRRSGSGCSAMIVPPWPAPASFAP